jgi:hypothetical protein
MDNEVLSTSFFSAILEQDGIVRLTWIPNAEITLAAAKESVAAVETLSQGKVRPLLVDMRSAKSIDREARAYYGSPGMKAANAIALLADSAVSQVLANFFLRINKPTIPTQMFTSETEALKWLKTIA